MREIKFRLPVFLKGKFHHWHYWGFIREPYGLVFVGIPIDPETALKNSQQYTGLKDKNGIELYEGDLLGGIFGDAYIGYCDKCKSFECISKEFGCMSCLKDLVWGEIVEEDGNLEVIGNIWENGDLLQ